MGSGNVRSFIVAHSVEEAEKAINDVAAMWRQTFRMEKLIRSPLFANPNKRAQKNQMTSCRLTICEEIHTATGTRIKIASSAIVKGKQYWSWTEQDLEVAGLPEQHRTKTLDMLREHHSGDRMYHWERKEFVEKLGYWLSANQEAYEVEEWAWYRDLFHWLYDTTLEAGKEIFMKKAGSRI